ncbi:MAG TPA: hypothetical protein VLI06_05640 [Solimonas sp.]|nr:hypothetical protein [Solimonas sp.]
MGTPDESFINALDDDLVETSLQGPGVPERLHYATGVLLDETDFREEQCYHRGRLARALSSLFGFGTLGGLRVSCAGSDNAELEIAVAPGLALDRLGRLIELRRTQVLRLGRWLDFRRGLDAQDPRRNEVIAAVHGDPAVLALDVFLRFVVCPHGRTPAFAAGPFNATDYTVPSRLADAFELNLRVAASDRDPVSSAVTLRRPASGLQQIESELAAADALADANLRRNARRDALLRHVLDDLAPLTPAAARRLPRLAEQARDEYWDELFLARLLLPVTRSDAEPFPQPELARPGLPADLADNRLRPIALHPGAWRGQI